MEIYILDSSRAILGPVGKFSSLIWVRNYYEPGTFEFHAEPEYFGLMDSGTWLYRADTGEIGRIRSSSYVMTDKGTREACIKGFSADQVLNERVINNQINVSGTPEAIARSLVKKYCITPASRRIAGLILGSSHGLGTSVTTQVTGETLGEWLHELEKDQEMSHQIIYDFINDDLLFECYQGLDRTQNQALNSWAVFSDQYANILTMNYRFDDSEAKNYAYVAGEGEGNARTVVEVDIRPNSSVERREIFIDARDLKQTYTDENGDEQTYSDAEYADLLRQRGLEKLTGYLTIETIDADIDAGANLIYKQDFDLGDLCTIRLTEVGLEIDARITSIREVYEGAAAKIDVTFGQDSATSLIRVIKREAKI